MRLRLPLHGRSHLENGSDPIPFYGDGWRFNRNNQGGWGYVIANDSTDIDYGELGMVLLDLTGEGMFIGSIDGTDVATALFSRDGILIATVNALTINFGEDSTVNIDTAGKTYVIKDSAGNPLVTYTG